MFLSFRSSILFLNNKLFRKLNSKQTMSFSTVFPSSVRGAKDLNRALFTTEISVPCLKLETESLSKVMPILKKFILKMPKFKPVQATEDGSIVYLDPTKVENPDTFPEEEKSLLNSKSVEKIILNYENFTANEILKAIMPENMEVPTSFSQIGHIIHLNLQDFQLPFGKIIGEVYLDKIPNSKTVVNKTSNIDSTYRFFQMKILVGDSNTVVTVKENYCIYTFDFAKVYWNPRLSTEHQVITDLIKPQEVLYDVFAGVGPFAIPVAKKGVSVLANDLNPESFKWLQNNAKINKVEKRVQIFNLDGRKFVEENVRKDLLRRRKENLPGTEHIVMNLPASAVDFLDVFHDWLSEEESSLVYQKAIYVHVYCFVKLQEGENPIEKAKILVESKLGYGLDEDLLKNIHCVRNVAPMKEMLRVTFLLKARNVMENGEPIIKKIKVDNNDGGFVGKNGSQTNAAEAEEKCFQVEGSSNNEG